MKKQLGLGAVIVGVLCLSLGGPVGAQVVVPAGYSVEEVAAGLDGPEGMALVGAGQIFVCEAQANQLPGLPVKSDLTRVRRNGKTTTLSSGSGTTWVDVARDPSGGLFVTQLGGGLGGVQQIHPNGSPGWFVPTGNLTGIAYDGATGDLYVGRTSGSILRIDAAGSVSTFRSSTRADGLIVTDDRILLAAVLTRFVGGVPFSNQIVAYDLESGVEAVLADNLGTRIDFIALGRDGEIFATDSADGSLRRLVPDGSGGYTPEVFATGFSSTSVRFPTFSFNAVEVAPDGRIYVSDYGAGKIYVIAEE
ncbi:MAG: hypothetical protein K0U98_03590 [Deltaproteobacteria bacterium]|nr:hypothetical protein [Deltaproteobacteria bacterium]